MKTSKLFILAIALLLVQSVAFAQTGDAGVVTLQRNVGTFSKIVVGSAINVILTKGTNQSVSVETNANLQDKVITEVSGDQLELSTKGLNRVDKLNIYITTPQLNAIDATGASRVSMTNEMQADRFDIEASGASKVDININCNELSGEFSGASVSTILTTANHVQSEVSGASVVTFKGFAASSDMEVSGASKLKALELITDNSSAEISGVSHASITARKRLSAELSGNSTLSYLENDALKRIGKAGEYVFTFSGMENIKSIDIQSLGDAEDADNADIPMIIDIPELPDNTVDIDIDGRRVIITDDTVKVAFGDREIDINNEGGVKVKHSDKKKERKFNGHWAGIELGVNGYLNRDFGIDPGEEFLDLKYQKSMNVNINFFEQNINLIHNHFGLVTGLGFSWNNYRFRDDVVLTMEDNELNWKGNDPYPGADYKKSKLTATYLNVPLMLEYQTNSKSKTNSFHLSAGAIGGLRIGTHTKNVYQLDGYQKVKERDDFYLNPFKVDGVVKIGWGIVNLYATMSLNPLFKTNKAPELYPFSVGLCLDQF